MALTKTQVSELYVAIFNRASEGEGNTYWQGLDGSAADIANEMLATDAAQAYFGASLDTDQAFIEHIYLNTLGKTYADDAEGIDYWVERLEAGADRGALIVELVAAAQDPQYAGTAAQQQFLNRVEVSDYTADNVYNAPADFGQVLGFDGDLQVTEDPISVNDAEKVIDGIAATDPGEGGGEPVEGGRIRLTEGRDDVTGSAGDDTFAAFAGQNQNGTIVNEFSTGDFIDGGAGRDKLEASILSDYQADSGNPAPINGRTVNVEEVHLEALSVNGSGAASTTVTVDAGRMDSVEEFWSDNSSANLRLEDVRLGSKLDITKDITFGLRDVDYDSDFTALFDSQSLVNASATPSNSALLIRIADVSTETPDNPLANVNLNLSFDLGGQTITLENVQADGGSYLGLVTAIRTALAEAGHGDLEVGLGSQYDQVNVANNTVDLPFTAQEVLVRDPSGNDFTNVDFTYNAIAPVADGFLVAGNAAPQDPGATSYLIESNLILDNAGRTSTAGDVHIGGMSNSNKGIQQFNVTVDRSSKIESLTTTGVDGTLRNIIIDSMGANGSLTIGRTEQLIGEIDANDFAGAALNLGVGVGGFEIQNLTFLDAGQTTADVTFNGANYGGRPSLETNAMLLTGSGDDVIDLGLYGVSESGSTWTSAAIVTGAGDDVVTVEGTSFMNGASINTGTGNDVVNGGNISTVIDTGAGNDVIYAENTGAKAFAQLDSGVANPLAGVAASGFSVAYATTNTAEGVNLAHLLYGRQVQVTVAMPEEATVAAADSFVDGFEVTASIQASNGYLTTERDLYEAAARAINEDPVVNKLVQARVDSNGDLQVAYLVDGTTAAGDSLVQIEVLGNWAGVQSNQANILNAVRSAYSDSNITATDLGLAYNAVLPVTAYAEQVTGTGVDAVFTVDMSAFAGNNSVNFEFDGVIDTVAIPTDFATDLDGETVTLGGVDFLIDASDMSAVTLTAQTPAAMVGQLTVENGVANAVGTQTVVGVDEIGLGTDSTSTGNNTVNGGAGDDVIVLSSNEAAVLGDVVVFDQGGFGNDTIVHFQVGTNGDLLDFSAWLNNEVQRSGSTSAESRVDATVELNAAATGNIGANDVAVATFGQLTFGTGISFANMSNADVLEALQANYAVAIETALVGGVNGTLKSVLLIENDNGTAADNEGLYKVYEVTSSNTATGADFTSATLVGTVDFGQTQGFTVENFDFVA